MRKGSGYGYWKLFTLEYLLSSGSTIEHLYGIDKCFGEGIRDPLFFPDEGIDTQNRKIRKVDDILGNRSNEIFCDV